MRALAVLPGSTPTSGGSTMIGGGVGANRYGGGVGVAASAGVSLAAGVGVEGAPAGAGDGVPGGGEVCAAAASATATTNARMENGAMTRRKRLLNEGEENGYAIFLASVPSRETAEARSVLYPTFGNRTVTKSFSARSTVPCPNFGW